MVAGNCLFNALSDQLYGDQSCNTQLRDATVEYMKNNPDRFKAFLVVHPGGGSRRNPKRKNHGSLAAIPIGPTPEEVDAAYKQHMKTMAKTGVYGDNLEIIAFAQAFKVDIMIFSEGGRFFYYVRCEKAEGEIAPMLCIVHHVSNLPNRSKIEADMIHRHGSTIHLFATLLVPTTVHPTSTSQNPPLRLKPK